MIYYTTEEFENILKAASGGDAASQGKAAFCFFYGYPDKRDVKKAVRLFESASNQGDAMASLMLGLYYETMEPDYARAISCYTKGYDLWNHVVPSDKPEAFSALKTRIMSLALTKGFCTWKDDSIRFSITDSFRKTLASKLPELSAEIAGLGARITQKKEDAEREYQYQDTLLLPAEIIKTVAARDIVKRQLAEASLPVPAFNELMENAMGRCLVDDDESSDNDFIISGIRMIAGHDKDPLWLYRAGLWYEFDDESRDLQEAYSWYKKAEKDYAPASKALKRISRPDPVTAVDCVKKAQGYSNNRELANAWWLEAAVRGDAAAVDKLRQLGNAETKDVCPARPFYEQVKEEKKRLQKSVRTWEIEADAAVGEVLEKIKREKDALRRKLALEEKRRKEEEEKRLREAEEERRRKEMDERQRLEMKKKQPLLDKLKEAADETYALLESFDDRAEEMQGLSSAVTDRARKLIPKKRKLAWGLFLSLPDPSEKDAVDSLCSLAIRQRTRYQEIADHFSDIKRKTKSLLQRTNWEKTEKQIITATESVSENNRIIGAEIKEAAGLLTSQRSVQDKVNAVSSVSSRIRPNWPGVIAWAVVLLVACLSILLMIHRRDRRVADPDQETAGFYDYEEPQEEIDSAPAAYIDESSAIVPEKVIINDSPAVAPVAEADPKVSDNWKSRYDYVYSQDSKTGWYKVEIGNKKGYVDKNGKEVIPVKYDYIYSQDSKTGWYKVEIGNKKGYVDKNGKEVIPVKYDYIYSQDSKTGWFKVEIGDKKGILSSEGKVILPVEYDYFGSVSSDGTMLIEKGGKSGRIDKKGNIIVPLQ